MSHLRGQKKARRLCDTGTCTQGQRRWVPRTTHLSHATPYGRTKRFGNRLQLTLTRQGWSLLDFYLFLFLYISVLSLFPRHICVTNAGTDLPVAISNKTGPLEEGTSAYQIQFHCWMNVCR